MQPMIDPPQSLPGQRALVTGGTGFIGSHLVEHLLAAGWEVHMLVRPNAERAALPPDGVQTHPYRGKTADVVAATERSRPDVVFHLASLFLAQHTQQQVAPMIEANVLIGAQLLEAMSAVGVKSMVNTGTSWQHFQRDDFHPVNLYAATKQAFEDILAYYADANHIRTITLSLFDSYGPRDTRKKLLHLLLKCLETNQELQMSPGHQIIDLAHVDDICKAFLQAATLVRDPNHPPLASYAVSGGERMTLREIVATLEKVTGRTLHIDWGARPYRPREVMRPWDGPPMPGWQPAIRLADGFKALLRERSL
jgi:nucleoside-diphosphate-sugar epimerase